MAFGALFLKETPWSCEHNRQHLSSEHILNPSTLGSFWLDHASSPAPLDCTYSLVEVDGVLARDNVGDGGAGGLASLLGRRHFCR